MLDLAPEIETTVRDYAAREGVSIDVFFRRLLFTYAQQQTSAAADMEWAAFQARLDEPPRDIPALKQLFSEQLPF